MHALLLQEPDPLGLALLDYFANSAINLVTASTKARVCSVCVVKAEAKSSKCALKASCLCSMASIRSPARLDKAESALAVASDCLSEASQPLAKVSNCASKARSKGVS